MEQKWLLTDLHMHSGYSAINKKGDRKRVKSMTAKEFVDILKENDVELFSVTDHNYFSDTFYNELQQYICDNNLEMAFILGTELDTFIEMDGSEKCIHICFYFDENTDRSKLHTIINSLYKDANGNDLKPTLSQILDKLYDLKTKYIVVPHGDKDRGLFKILRQESLSGKPDFYKYAMYKVFSAFDVRPNFYNESIRHWAYSFYEKSCSFNSFIEKLTEDELKELNNKIVAKIRDESFVLSSDEQIIFEYIQNYGSYFAYFSFSDWHNAEKYKTEINNFIFGSLENAFGSFEMATLDPESRVQHSYEKTITIPQTLLKSVSFKVKGKEKHVEFSPGLNAVIGKRGSGKSLLLAVLHNLNDKASDDGAIKKYKSLEVEDISAINRGGTPISLGSLNSVVFLSQDDISTIFDNPENAQETIKDYFKDIAPLDKTQLYTISSIASKLKQYNVNYKSITDNIKSIRDTQFYTLTKLEWKYSENIIRKHFENSEKALRDAKTALESLKLNTDNLNEELTRIGKLKAYYLFLLKKYKDVIDLLNDEIDEVNKTNTSNQKIDSANRAAIKSAEQIMMDNLDIHKNLVKLEKAFNILKLDDQAVEVNTVGKYLFATYYEIPQDLKEELEAKLSSNVYYGKTLRDIKNYIAGIGKLNKTASGSLVDKFNEYISGDIFESRKGFYEIVNKNIDYEQMIHTNNDLKKYVESKDIIDLTQASLGTKSVAYLDMLFSLRESILVLDQPEDNIDNDYISNYLVPNIKANKKVKQLIFVTHNPSVAVYGDAFNYIYVTNDEEISYTSYLIEKAEDKKSIIKILEGGEESFSNRNKKFGNVLGAEEYENK